MATVTTSLVVQFSNGNNGILTAEIDAREAGLNGGDTSFSPGDIAYFLVFKSPDVVLDLITSSIGSAAITSMGVGNYIVGDTGEEEWLSFADAKEADLSKPYSSGFEYEWFGNNLGVPVVQGNKVVVPSKGVGMLRVKYNSQYTAFGLSSPSNINGETDFNILVFIKGHN